MYLLILVLTIPYIFILSKRNLHILQQNFYNENNRYLKWGIKNISKSFNLFDLILTIISIINLFIKNKYLILINALYLIYYFYKNNRLKREQVKIPLKITSRVKRLSVTITILYLIPIVIAYFLNIYYVVIYNVMILFNFIIIYLSNIINKPIENYVFHYYRRKAVRKLNAIPNLDVIGITGSYGKTSSKNILNDILSVKYNVLPSPKNYNTQYGLIMTINNYLDKFDEFFIAEMGAFKRGRIKLLCNLVKPKYGILTTIGEAHLETFKSRENIQKGKFELIESLPKDGLGILNMDDPYQVNYNLKNKVNILWISTKNKEADVYADNIKIDKNGMSFDAIFKNNSKVRFNTKLLGLPNIYNILAGVAFGKYIGMSDDELIRGVSLIKPIEHRLELKKLHNYTIIDDAYNSNPVGASMALDVLNLMDGEKIVVTPGMIELGSEEYRQNYEFGSKISEVADYVILVGKKQTVPILNGLKSKGYSNDKIKIINDVKEAFNIIDNLKLNKEAYILLENDLPDIFNEKE